MTRMVLILVFVAGATAAGYAQSPAPPDTTMKAAPADSVVGVVIVPSYSGVIRGNVTNMTLGNSFSTSLKHPNGVTSVVKLSTEESFYRLQDRRDTNNSFNASALYLGTSGLTMNGSISDTRYFNRLVTASNTTQDLFNDAQKATANAKYTRPIYGGLKLDTNASLGIGRSEQTFLDDQTRSGSLGLGLQFVRKGTIDASARGFVHLISQDAESRGRGFSGLGTSEDSVVARVQIMVLDSSTVETAYSRFLSKEDYLELPRDAFGAQQFDPSKISPERQSKDVRNVSVKTNLKLVRGLVVTAGSEHTDAATYFAEARQRTSRDTGDGFSSSATYTWGGPREILQAGTNNLSLDVERSEGTHWLGPERAGSYDDEDTKIRFGWTQALSKTLGAYAQAGASLTQAFYGDTDRDWDQRYQYANLRLKSSIFPKVAITVYTSVAKTDYLNIKASQSQRNRAETIYELRPEYTYTINERISLTQKYWMNIQFTDYVFQENENFLDRNFTFSNQVLASLTSRISVDFYYAVRFSDKGSYLRPRPDVERVLEIYQEERRDEFKFKFRYQIAEFIALTGANEYNRGKDILNPSGAVFKDGGVEFGMDGTYAFGEKGTLKYSMKRVKRFGAFNADPQKDYWVVDSSLNYAF
jgi:hypothetical protein